jgi:hypothetical protein
MTVLAEETEVDGAFYSCREVRSGGAHGLQEVSILSFLLPCKAMLLSTRSVLILVWNNKRQQHEWPAQQKWMK